MSEREGRQNTKPLRARLKLGEQEARAAAELCQELHAAIVEELDEETILFLHSQAQSKLGKTLTHVRFAFSGAGQTIGQSPLRRTVERKPADEEGPWQ